MLCRRTILKRTIIRFLENSFRNHFSRTIRDREIRPTHAFKQTLLSTKFYWRQFYWRQFFIGQFPPGTILFLKQFYKKFFFFEKLFNFSVKTFHSRTFIAKFNSGKFLVWEHFSQVNFVPEQLFASREIFSELIFPG